MIRLRTLGTLHVDDAEGRELRAVLAQPRRLALLLYLALAAPRGPQRRDVLMALFWPAQDADHARNALNQAVHFLRRELGAAVVVSRGGEDLGLAWDDIWCDAVAFERALDAGQLAEAMELYRGDLLEGFHVADAGPEFDQWLERERSRLAGRYAAAAEHLASERAKAGDQLGAALWWKRLAARDPYSSRLAARLMQALAAAGDPAAALQHGQAHATLLREDLGIAPDAEVESLLAQLQAPRAPPQWPAPAQRSATASRAEATRAMAADTPRAASWRRPWAVLVGLAIMSVIAAGALMLAQVTSGSSAPAIRSLAVLPFENLSGDSTYRPFADAMHDALITELARYPDLLVISRTSVMRYRQPESRALPEIARELKVDGIVEGSLFWASDGFRMNVQLINGATDQHLWTDSYRRDLKDVLSLQIELASAIARQVRAASRPAQRAERRAPGHADSVPAELFLMELFRRGRQAELSRSLAGIQTAKAAYRLAIERDSSFALGFAGLAAAYGLEAHYAYAPLQSALDSARLMAQRAVRLDSTLPEVRTALAVTLADARRFEDAEREFQRAIELGPSDAHARYWYGILLVVLGRGGEALHELEIAQRLDPFAPRGLLAMQRYATWLVTGQRPHFNLPVRDRRPILRLEPTEPWARAREAVELAQEGRCAEARTDLQVAQQGVQPGNLQMLAFEGEVYWRCGDRGRTRQLLRQAKLRPDARDHGNRIAWLHAVLGERDSAFAWIERQGHWTMAMLAQISGGWVFDSLRSDPRYPQVMRHLGIRRSDQN